MRDKRKLNNEKMTEWRIKVYKTSNEKVKRKLYNEKVAEWRIKEYKISNEKVKKS